MKRESYVSICTKSGPLKCCRMSPKLIRSLSPFFRLLTAIVSADDELSSVHSLRFVRSASSKSIQSNCFKSQIEKTSLTNFSIGRALARTIESL